MMLEESEAVQDCSPSTVRTDNAPKVRFSATLDQKEPEIGLELV
jgi:hypothetical protein